MDFTKRLPKRIIEQHGRGDTKLSEWHLPSIGSRVRFAEYSCSITLNQEYWDNGETLLRFSRERPKDNEHYIDLSKTIINSHDYIVFRSREHAEFFSKYIEKNMVSIKCNTDGQHFIDIVDIEDEESCWDIFLEITEVLPVGTIRLIFVTREDTIHELIGDTHPHFELGILAYSNDLKAGEWLLEIRADEGAMDLLEELFPNGKAEILEFSQGRSFATVDIRDSDIGKDILYKLDVLKVCSEIKLSLFVSIEMTIEEILEVTKRIHGIVRGEYNV